MKKAGMVLISGVLALSVTTAFADIKGGKINAKAEFEEHCAACHKAGGNIINPKKTLSKKDRMENGVKTAADIMKLMRNPGPGMTKFDEKSVPDKEAKAIANYIIKTFK